MKSSECACRVGLDEILAELRVDELPGVTSWTVLPDWRGEPSLSVRDAAAYVAQWRAERAAAQTRQDRQTAREHEAYVARQNAEAIDAMLAHRAARREAAIRRGGMRAVHALRGVVSPGDEEAAWARGRAAAAAAFDAGDEQLLPDELP